MKRLLFILFSLLLTMPAVAQQQKADKRTHTIFAFKDFQDGKVLQPFGRFTRAKVNILLKNSTLCFLDSGVVKEAYVNNVLGVQFDSVRYMKLNEKQMGRVVAQSGYNYLLCVTTINKKKLEAETEGGDNLPFLDIPDAGFFYEVDGQAFEFDKGYPLTDKYYFSIMGTVIPANESQFKKYVKPELKTAFRNLMYDHYFSWSDPASLTQLFTYIKEQ